MEPILAATPTEPQGELSPTHPDPTQRIAYWAARARTIIEEDSARLGPAQAIEWALSDAWYYGVQHGIRMFAAATRDAARAKAAAQEATVPA